MPEQQIPVTQEFKGINLRVAPHALPPGYSQDCANCRPYNGLLGRLGPRKGRAKASLTPYAAALCGLHCSDDYMIVAIDDGSSVTIMPESLLYPSETGGSGGGGSPWSGPTITNINGFYARWQGFSAGPDNPTILPKACNVPIGNATKAIATCPSSTIYVVMESTATIKIYLKFDLDDYVLANTIEVSLSSSCCGGGCGGDLYQLQVVESPTPVTCTGKSALTGIKVTSETADGPECTISGDIYVMGTAATLENL